jgi:hypothetical protein
MLFNVFNYTKTTQACKPAGNKTRPRRDADRFPPSSAEVVNE